MAASMVRSYKQFRLLRQVLGAILRYEQSTYYILSTCSMTHMEYKCYHVTPICLKQRIKENKRKVRLQLVQENFDKYVPLESEKKKLSVVEVWRDITVNELAICTRRRLSDVLDALKDPNYNRHTVLSDASVISATVKKLGATVKWIAKDGLKHVNEVKVSDAVRRPPPDESVLVRRRPVVTIMGHVDHGKTTLLDALRNTSVVEKEFGGITQHIGAFNVTLKSGEEVTFLDTPGHAAFTAMRQRGAHVTDIVVLVVAADDGVKDQTLQSIEMARKANVPIIVAMNKIDKPNANIERAKEMLAEHGIVVEDLGGDVQCIHISALKGINLEELTEAIVVQAEIMGLKADPTGFVEGVIIEVTNDAGRGKLVTALIQRGTLKRGSLLVSGLAWAKVRAMFNDSGKPVVDAKPPDAIQIIGWRELPLVGDEILQVENERTLQRVLKYREAQRNEDLAKKQEEAANKKYEEHLHEYKKILSMKNEFGRSNPIVKSILRQKRWSAPKASTEEDNTPAVNVIIKGDVAGSIEAILDIFDLYTDDNLCELNVVHYGIGPVSESDLQLAATFDAIIYQFNVTASKTVEEEAKQKGISIRHHNVIYKMIDDLKEEINNKLPEVDAEEVLGEASVQQLFQIKEGKKKVNVAGCLCTNGVLTKSEMYHVKRGNQIIHTGKLMSMKYLKDEVTSIKVNVECGLRLEDPTVLFERGDTIVCFKPIKVAQKIDWKPGF